MAHSCDFVIVKFVPDPIRDESLNAAVVVLGADALDVRVTPNPERLRAIAPHIVPETLDELRKSLESIDDPALSTAERIGRLRHLPGVTISEPGKIQAENAAELDNNLNSLVGRLLTTVRAPTTSLPLVKATRLVQELSQTFRRENLLGRDKEDLAKHKIVRNVPISTDGSLRADFVAKNRVMHVTETVDLRSTGDVHPSRLKDIAVAAVTLDEAKRKFGSKTKRYLVFAGSVSAEKQAFGFLKAAEHHAEEVFNFSSKSDRASYLDHIFAALRHDLAGVARVGGPKAKVFSVQRGLKARRPEPTRPSPDTGTPRASRPRR